ncbi:MAG: hypothetical protein WC635_10960 [Bacteriovorax sp.]|jgi:hypothetical protein
MKKKSSEEAKKIARDKLQLALDNLLEAEVEGAEALAPETLIWAKQKIYDDRKTILKNFDDEDIIEEASDDAAAAAAKLLSIVREQKEAKNKPKKIPDQVMEQEAIKNLINEGSPVS